MLASAIGTANEWYDFFLYSGLILKDELHCKLDDAVIALEQSAVATDVVPDLSEVRRVDVLLLRNIGLVKK